MGIFDHHRFSLKDQNARLASDALGKRNGELRELARTRSVEDLVLLSGSVLGDTKSTQAEIFLKLFDRPLVVQYPSMIVYDLDKREVPVFIQSLILYYLTTANGSKPGDTWVSFADLPGGRMYSQAFQGYTGDPLVKMIGEDVRLFKDACTEAGGQQFFMADAAYRFQGLPRIPLLLCYWAGEDEFPSTCKVLYDSSAINYMPIDGCAIIGSMLTRNVMHQIEKKERS